MDPKIVEVTVNVVDNRLKTPDLGGATDALETRLRPSAIDWLWAFRFHSWI